MIADLKNLGSPMGGLSGLGSQSKVDRLNKKPTEVTKFGEVNGTDSFEQMLAARASNKDLSQPGKAPEIQKSRTGQNKAENLETVKTEPSERKESSEAKDSAPTAKAGKKNAKSRSAGNAETREQVMLEFMDSMESEFGIPPTRIVEAMTHLSDQDLLRSPEETASQVISQLDLPYEDQNKAMTLYMGMIAQLQSQQQAGQGPAMPDVRQQSPQLDSTATLAAPPFISMRERRNQLNQSLDRMNQQFFMRSNPAKPSLEEGGNLSGAGTDRMSLLGMEVGDNRLLGVEGYGENAALSPKEAWGLQSEMGSAQVPSSSASEQQNVAARQTESKLALEDLGETGDYQQLAKSLAALSASAAALNDSLKADPQNAKALAMEQSQQASMAAGTSALGAGALMAQGSGGENQDFASADKEQGSKDFLTKATSTAKSGKTMASASDFFVPGQGPLPSSSVSGESVSTSAPSGTEALATNVKGTEGSKENRASIQQVMNQAQYLIRRGGGESRIQMNPEGLGQLHLKVAVNEGKVNVEMSAETKEAKKLLESSVSDLKSNLHSQHLKLESVKVDVGQNFGNDRNQSDNSQNQQHRQPDLRQDMQQRQQTRQFFEQFRDDGRREGFIDSPGLKAYSGSRGPAPLQPAEMVSTSKRRSGSGKGSGLDLVA